MLKNYIKIALKVLKRNKLYTGISLFGISFTLMVLMLASAILENELGSNPPLSKKDRILFIPVLQGEGFKKETITKYDSSTVNGVLTIDTVSSIKVNEGEVNQMSTSSLGYNFYKNKLSKMQTAELSSVFIDFAPMNVFPNGEKLSLNGNLTDENYWKIFDFNFIEGAPFTKQTIDNQAKVIILNQSSAEKYFGKQNSYLGKEVLMGLDGNFKVVGIIKNVNTSNRSLKADYFIPLTWATPKDLDYGFGYFGSCVVAILAKDKTSVKSMETELRKIEAGLEKVENFDRYRLLEKNATDLYAWNFMGTQKDRNGKKFLYMIFGLLALFLIIPVLNLVNLNVTRIFERSSEIGVRKAFGAKSSDLLYQFLFENLIITFIGGLIGLILTAILIQVLNQSEIFGVGKLSFNFSILLISIFITFLFGIISGFLPAWKIAKTQVSDALKTGKI